MHRSIVQYISIIFLAFTSMSFIDWHYNLDDAKQIAKSDHKHILLNFSGSDWCAPCIRLHKDIFESEPFQKFASTNLVLVNADFPRLKKNQLPLAQQKLNEAVADKYNSKGSFPLTLLLDENGKLIEQWEGYPKETMDEFMEKIQLAIDHDK